MIDSQVKAVSTSAVALTPPGTATDMRSGYSVLISNTLTTDIKLGNATSQNFTVKAGATMPCNELESDEVIWVRSPGGAGNIELFWQGVTA